MLNMRYMTTFSRLYIFNKFSIKVLNFIFIFNILKVKDFPIFFNIVYFTI